MARVIASYELGSLLVDSYADHAFQGEDKAYRRYDTLPALAGTAQRYFAFISHGPNHFQMENAQ